jgi:protein disulfide-isomerase
LFFCAAFIAAFAIAAAEGKPGWLTNFKQAQEEAKANKKLVLMDFTGSDWCGWCIKLDREVFSQPAFKEYAAKNLVLLDVDFPRGKRLTAAQTSQNEELAQRFGVQGFPTLVILDSAGKQLAQLGYEAAVPPDSRVAKATPEAFIATLEKLRNK